jgi:hypothetical protein
MKPLPDDAAIRALAADILRRSEYAQSRATDWLRHVLEWLARLANDHPPLYWTSFGALLLVGIVLLVHLTIAIRSALWVAPRPEAARGDASATSFVADADALAAGGRFLEAARRMQLAVIELLLRRRVVTLARSDPNRTLRARLREATLPAAERGELIALIDRVERSWFRDGAADRALYDAWRRAHERLLGA